MDGGSDSSCVEVEMEMRDDIARVCCYELVIGVVPTVLLPIPTDRLFNLLFHLRYTGAVDRASTGYALTMAHL